MKYAILVIIATFSLISCSDSSDDNQVPLDELHRPADYTNKVEFILKKDFDNDSREMHPIVSFNGEKDFESLLEQLWKLAFSGDSELHGISVLGEFDEDNIMDPKQLVDALKQFDTVRVDDLITGEVTDSILDMSFTQNEVSALSLYFTCDQDLEPYAIGFGKKVYSPLGEYLGISNKFFLQLSNEMRELDCKQRLAIQSDSNGLMQPSFFEFYFDNDQTPFQDNFSSSGDSTMTVSFEIQLDSKGNRMRFVTKDPETEV